MAQSAIVESVGTEGDAHVKPEGEGEAESLMGDQETLGEIGGVDQPISYIIHFPMQLSCT